MQSKNTLPKMLRDMMRRHFQMYRLNRQVRCFPWSNNDNNSGLRVRVRAHYKEFIVNYV